MFLSLDVDRRMVVVEGWKCPYRVKMEGKLSRGQILYTLTDEFTTLRTTGIHDFTRRPHHNAEKWSGAIYYLSIELRLSMRSRY